MRSNNIARGLALATVLVALAGCSEYTDRRDSISLNAGDALAADRVSMMVDPWPRWSGQRDIAFNGQKMQSAVERYRTNKVIPPHGIGTSSTYQPANDSQTSGADNAKPVGPTITQP